MRNDEKFIDKIRNTFPDRLKNDCFSVSKLAVDYIQDNKNTQICYFTSGVLKGFKIENKHTKTINLFSIDGCFFADDDAKRCDGIVFDDIEICFLELKLNVTTKKGKNKRKRFNDAIIQLENTISFFKNNINDEDTFCKLLPEAYISMNKNSYPSDSASRKRKKVEFLERNSIPLIDKNIKVFE